MIVATRDYILRAGAGTYNNIGPDLFMASLNHDTSLGCIQFVQYGYVEGEESRDLNDGEDISRSL